MTPLIFTKKYPNIKLNKQAPPKLAAFENYLQIVRQMYYKKTTNFSDIINFHDENTAELGKPSAAVLPKPGKKGRGGHIAKLMRNKLLAENENKKETSNIEEKVKPEFDLEIINPHQDILDNLISPLRTPMIYGRDRVFF
jgi:hypothetical protein